MTPEAAARHLGVPLDASADTITRAFRERVRDAHPDTGGDEESFIRLLEARDALLAHRPEQRVVAASPAPAPPFSLPLFVTWVALLVLSCLLTASGGEPAGGLVVTAVRSIILCASFAAYALTGAAAWRILALASIAVTAVFVLVATTIGGLLGLLVALPAIYGLLLMGVRRSRLRA